MCADGSNAVSVILVSFNSSATIGRAIASIPPAAEIIVVDNDSSDASVEMLADYPLKVIQLEENVGFGRACNAGAAEASREFLLFLNPDSVLQQSALDELVRAARTNLDGGGLNPEIEDNLGRSCNRAPSRFSSEHRNRRVPVDTSQATTLEVDMLSGAALLIKRDVFKEIGGFDPELFLYFEDDDISLRLLKAGYKLFRHPAAVVRHEGGASSPSSLELEQFKNYHWERSYGIVCRKHGFKYAYAKRFLMHSFQSVSGLVGRDRAKVSKHLGRLKAIVGADPKDLYTQLQQKLSGGSAEARKNNKIADIGAARQPTP